MKPWRFSYASDLHVGSPRSFRFRPEWSQRWQVARQQIINSEPELLILGGDMTRDGVTHRGELEQIKADLDQLGFPYHAIPGNHETGGKLSPGSPDAIQHDYVRLYRSVFGPDMWSFVHRDVRFSGFNSFLAGSGLPEEDVFWDWFEMQVDQPRVAHHVWFTHAALFADRLHEPNWDPKNDRAAWYFTIDEPHCSRMLEVFKKTGAELVISGHIHCRRVVEREGITFFFAPSTAFGSWGDRWPDGDETLGWLDCRVDAEGIHPVFVPLAEDIPDSDHHYGPGGNPPLEGRDYTVAQQQPPFDLDEQRFPRATEDA